MLIAAVRRVRKPGCKFEAPQGTGKSTLLKILAGEENFSDAEIVGLEKREQQEAVQGIWIYEIGELEGLSRSEVSKVKLFASKTVDSARPAYGRHRVDRPRRCIFVATTNDDKYLRDTTGNRRFWPIKVPVIDLAAIARDRDQLWAEAALGEATGESLVIPEKLWPEATARQLARMEIDPWEEVLGGWLANMEADNKQGDSGCCARATGERDSVEWRVSSNFLLSTVLGISQERQNNTHTKRLAGIMRGLGWTRSETTMRIGKLVCRGFVKSGSVTRAEACVTPLAPVVAPKLAVLDGGKEKKPQEKDVTGETLKRRML
jgi:predicted P-loop ATPase